MILLYLSACNYKVAVQYARV